MMLEETRDTVTVPATLMLRMLASLSHARRSEFFCGDYNSYTRVTVRNGDNELRVDKNSLCADLRSKSWLVLMVGGAWRCFAFIRLGVNSLLAHASNNAIRNLDVQSRHSYITVDWSLH